MMLTTNVLPHIAEDFTPGYMNVKIQELRRLLGFNIQQEFGDLFLKEIDANFFELREAKRIMERLNALTADEWFTEQSISELNQLVNLNQAISINPAHLEHASLRVAITTCKEALQRKDKVSTNITSLKRFFTDFLTEEKRVARFKEYEAQIVGVDLPVRLRLCEEAINSALLYVLTHYRTFKENRLTFQHYYEAINLIIQLNNLSDEQWQNEPLVAAEMLDQLNNNPIVVQPGSPGSIAEQAPILSDTLKTIDRQKLDLSILKIALKKALTDPSTAPLGTNPPLTQNNPHFTLAPDSLAHLEISQENKNGQNQQSLFRQKLQELINNASSLPNLELSLMIEANFNPIYQKDLNISELLEKEILQEVIKYTCVVDEIEHLRAIFNYYISRNILTTLAATAPSLDAAIRHPEYGTRALHDFYTKSLTLFPTLCNIAKPHLQQLTTAQMQQVLNLAPAPVENEEDITQPPPLLPVAVAEEEPSWKAFCYELLRDFLSYFWEKMILTVALTAIVLFTQGFGLLVGLSFLAVVPLTFAFCLLISAGAIDFAIENDEINTELGGVLPLVIPQQQQQPLDPNATTPFAPLAQRAAHQPPTRPTTPQLLQAVAPTYTSTPTRA